VAHPPMMNRQYIDAQHVLTRYLAGQLSDAEREAFETYYVEHPQVLQELEIAAKLKLGLTLLEDSGELDAAPRRHWLPGLAAAALLLAVIAVAVWFAKPPPMLAASLGSLAEFRQAPPLTTRTYTIERTRSRGVDARVRLPPTGAICLQVLPEHSARTYGLRVNELSAGAAPREVASLRALRADTQGLVTVYADPRRWRPGRYEIILSADSTDAASSFLILVEPASSNPSSNQ